MTIPDGATHLSEFYGVVPYWQKLEVSHFNDVTEEWQKRYVWLEWSGVEVRGLTPTLRSRSAGIH